MDVNTNIDARPPAMADPIVTRACVGGRTLVVETSLALVVLNDPVLSARIAARHAAEMVANLA